LPQRIITSRDSVILRFNPLNELLGRASARAPDDVALKEGVTEDVWEERGGEEGRQEGGSRENGESKGKNIGEEENVDTCMGKKNSNIQKESLPHTLSLTHQY
jgi:hypothetical protein